MRQYGLHTREAIYIIRRPFGKRTDHFGILTSHGAGIVTLYDQHGTVHGGRRGPWVAEGGTASQNGDSINFENCYEVLSNARKELVGLLGTIGQQATALSADSSSVPAEAVSRISAEAEVAGLMSIAMFTSSDVRFELDDSVSRDDSFVAMTLESAVARTVFHTPNLLRAIDRQVVVYSNTELQFIAETLEHSATALLSRRSSGLDSMAGEDLTSGNTSSVGDRTASQNSKSNIRRWQWVALIATVLAVLLYVVIHSVSASHNKTNPAKLVTPPPVVHPPSRIVIELPSEVQLFVSPMVYRTRGELDRALAQGEGHRYIPRTEQVIVFDSSTFAKGLYGYFKVDNTWRKGKLLQTFKTLDTIKIDNFLAPLADQTSAP